MNENILNRYIRIEILKEGKSQKKFEEKKRGRKREREREKEVEKRGSALQREKENQERVHPNLSSIILPYLYICCNRAFYTLKRCVTRAAKLLLMKCEWQKGRNNQAFYSVSMLNHLLKWRAPMQHASVCNKQMPV